MSPAAKPEPDSVRVTLPPESGDGCTLIAGNMAFKVYAELIIAGSPELTTATLTTLVVGSDNNAVPLI